jgi:UDP-glucose 4-epimerase
MKKILITGGAGFIARSLFEGLQSEYSVISCTRKELDLSDFDNVFSFIKNNNFDVIIHTATYDAAPVFSKKDPEKVLENNLRMFFNIERCHDYFGKMIFFGSGAEFGREYWQPKMAEDFLDQFVPKDQYGFSKYIMTKCIRSIPNIYNLRLFGVFGRYDDWRYRFIPNICYNAVIGENITINQNKIYDYMYIDDLVKIVKWFLLNIPKKNVYNVCSGASYDLKTLAEKTIKISGKKLDITIKNEGLGKEYSGDNRRLLSELNGFKFMPIEDSIKNLYDWYNENKSIFEFKKNI